MWTLKNGTLFRDSDSSLLGVVFEATVGPDCSIYEAAPDRVPASVVDVDTPYGPKLLVLVTATTEDELHARCDETMTTLEGNGYLVHFLRPAAQVRAAMRHFERSLELAEETSGRGGAPTMLRNAEGGLDVDTDTILTNARHAVAVIELTDDPTRLQDILTDAEAFALFCAGLGPRLVWTLAETMGQCLHDRIGGREVHLPDPYQLDSETADVAEGVPDHCWGIAAAIHRRVVLDQPGRLQDMDDCAIDCSSASTAMRATSRLDMVRMTEDLDFEEFAGLLLVMLCYFAAALRAVPQR